MRRHCGPPLLNGEVRHRQSVRRVAIEDFALEPGEEPFDLVFAVRVGALDGRHPAAGRDAMRRIAVATAPGARLFVDGREVPIGSGAARLR